MAHVGFLACGPGPGLLVLFGGVALGALVLTVSFLAGFVCLFTSRWKLGVLLTSIPAALFAIAYAFLQQQQSL